VGKSISGNSIFLVLFVPGLLAAQTGDEEAQRKWTDYADMQEITGPLQWPASDSGWLETTWNQSTPYKSACPVDTTIPTSPNSAVGCAGTALAQVVYYNQALGDLHFTFRDKYITPTRKIRIDQDSLKFGFPGFGELNTRVDRIKEKFQLGLSLDSSDLAALCFALGVVIKMDYTGWSSSSSELSNLGQDLKEKLNYSEASSRPLNNAFYELLAENAINGQPAILFLDNHAVVVDGFRSDGKYHFNFGLGETTPDDISKTWYYPNEFPDTSNVIYSGILNISPHPPPFNPQINVSDEPIMLPCSEIGKSSESRALVITNSGDTPVSIDHLLVPAPFYSDLRPAAPGSIWLNPGEDLTVGLRCMAENAGGICDSIQIIASYQGISRYRRIEIRGYGVPETGQTVSQLSTNTLWQADQSPYYINQSLSVPAGGQLIIEKGTRIFFTGPYQLTIGPDTRLSVRGSAADSVTITGIQAETGWRGILLEDSGDDDTLSYCKISGVSAARGQNALSVHYSNPYISHCLFTDNRSTFYGGALYMLGSRAIIFDCVFKHNICTARDGGGALHLGNDSSPLMTNLLIYGNQARNGGAIYCDGASLVLRNLTIAGNTALGEGAAIYLAGTNQMEISNTIIWNNEAQLDPAMLSERRGNIESGFIHYSDIDTSSWVWISENINSTAGEAFYSGAGNCYADPLFVSPVQNDYNLAFNSPCIDRGDPLDDYSMEPTPNGGCINMGAYGGTNQAAVSSPITIIEPLLVRSFSLAQNYPNPFNPLTTIDYELPITNFVNLTIYNLLGQKVATLVNQKQPAGRYQIQWNASGCASGVYYYHLTAGSFVETKKLTLLR